MITLAAWERRFEFALKAVEFADSSMQESGMTRVVLQEDPWLWEAD